MTISKPGQRAFSAVEIIQQFKDFAESIGSPIDGEIVADGTLRRAHGKDDKPGTLNISYKLHLDSRPAGFIENHKLKIRRNWKADQPARELTEAERRELADQRRQQAEKKAAQQAERQAGFKRAAERAHRIWEVATPITSQDQHPHLIEKKILPHGAKLYRGRLVYPIYDINRALVGVRFIGADGSKRPLKGALKTGAFGIIGQVKPGDTLLIAEGFSTSASLHEATGHPCFIAVDCSNLEATARAVRTLYPSSKIIVCADNDASGIGQKHAWRAARACKGFYCAPPEPGTDFNDLNRMEATTDDQ